ncbi:MAG: TatD family hydrolase [Bacteroidota bacterium]|nr:TatD family hydrolase [Bacteroidota bacterium]MDP4232829.1 TatD family hydrolase [Bacteroidota bacterium]MDP4242490.1 TatD family hydrolase [Bacteroidota bacterium]MDP4289032.1 TatD family hydrolase [Bacteroidota bacterium]
MFDTHCHLQDAAFDADRMDVLAQARKAGVTHIVAPATDLASFDGTLSLLEHGENVFGTLGIHPHSATEWSKDVRDRILTECQSNAKIVGIGEIGLDYHYDFSPRDVQRQAFREQIELAQELRKPIVVHTRESDADVFTIVRECYKDVAPDLPRGQFHCFSSTIDRMHEALELGFYMSFTGNITFTKSTLREVVRETPLDWLLLETDSPYLTPHPHRGTRNTPAQLELVARKVAEIKDLELSVVAKQTFENALRFFNLTLSRSLLILMLSLMALATAAGTASAQREQPAGGAPPDSVLTAERRRTEEMRKKQEAELAKEAEAHRLDSIKTAAKEQEEIIAKIQAQARQDSIKAAELLSEEQRRAEFLLTPMPWKAVGLGFSAGIGDMPMILGKPSLTPLSVLCWTVDASTAVTRRLDFDLSYSHMNVGDSFINDSVWNNGPGTNTFNKPVRFIAGQTYLVASENIGISAYSLDLRYVITRPASVIKFYFGIGYTHLSMTNEQHSLLMKDSVTTIVGTPEKVVDQTWSRGAIKLLFGVRDDFEIGSGFTLEPFAQIAGIGAFQGDLPSQTFVFRPDPQQIIMTQVNAGFTLYFGWFGVPRQQ